ncbi:hypothetical protein AMAG_06128 [Allomyces macrogynus ATCC 38327]|uniref:Vps72/YL1 C-terminal domain-containing protein n=1 Tax=Allomyces macrogynus (strain ATCC 38327) TaxID=578462 RepID=A0A0L0SEF3_ALLM3|nr:hypothetical protein AMAG_06128 [Allomyces macrogynus ATCC 38327]|eukprot:KNE60770.1 hypothetical protein AMAG_06128 [Allomyces macrogynus ATCC 38327]
MPRQTRSSSNASTAPPVSTAPAPTTRTTRRSARAQPSGDAPSSPPPTPPAVAAPSRRTRAFAAAATVAPPQAPSEPATDPDQVDNNDDDDDDDDDDSMQVDDLDTESGTGTAPGIVIDTETVGSPTGSSTDVSPIDHDDFGVTLCAPMDVLPAPKPFKKNAHFVSGVKKYRALPNLLSHQQTVDAAKAAAVAAELGEEATSPASVVGPSYTSIRAAPSVRPNRKYCDVTGLPANYTDPVSGLHYYDKEVYQYIKGLSSGALQQYMRLRNKSIII